MSEWHDFNSLGDTNTILRPKEDNLSLALTRLGVPYLLISQYLETKDVSFLFSHSQDPEYVKQLVELIASSKTSLPLTLKDRAVQRLDRNTHETMDRKNDRILKCSKELKDKYIHRSNILKIALLPSTQCKIHGVEDLHVPVLLKKSEISPDIPQMADLHADSFFKGPHITKKKILLFGPPGVGKTTEIKMWLHYWCHNKEGPLKDFHVVFYVDGAKLDPGTSLGEAIINQCLPADTEFSPEDVELMCQERQDEVLVILDNYTKWRKNDQVNPTSSLEDMVLLRNFGVLTLMVATTSGGVGDFREVYGNYDHVKIEGISEESVSTYVQKVFRQRKDFGLQVENSLRDTNLVSDMAASPLLLSIMCQIAKWCENPAVLGDLKTGSELTDMFIDCVIKHGGDGDSQVIKHSDKLENITIVQSEGNDDRSEKGEEVCSAAKSLREPSRSTTTTLQRSQSSAETKSLSKDEILEQLSAVAFRCYLKKDNPEELHLSEDDFDVCGVSKQDVINEGCHRGLLVRSSKDELMPSTAKAAEGKIIRFLCAPFQQRLAAKHFAKLLQGNDEEKQSFQTSLRKIGSIDNALSLRNLLLFACGESRDSAELIIDQVVNLTQTYALDMFPDPVRDDGVLTQAHGLYQYMIEFILDLNYEARSRGCFNAILCPLVNRLRILSPTVIMTRALAYLLEHAAAPNAPKLEEVNIEVFDVPREIKDHLPHHKHIIYNYEERARVSVEMSAFEDPHTCTMRKLSINVEPKKKKATRCTMGAQFPAPPSDTQPELTLPFKESGALPFTDDQEQDSAGEGCLPISVSAGHDRGVVSEGRSRRVIKKIDHKCIEEGDFIDEGRFGEVYKAYYEGKEYAMKRIKNVSSGQVAEVTREIKMNERVSHPNIVALHAYAQYRKGNKGGYRFELLMDYIEGLTLEEALFEKKLKDLETLPGQIELASKVSDAIAHIHANKCTHSDIKPNNILIKIPGNKPYVCDLGSGHVVTQSAMSMITSGKRYGVQRWMPPESSGQGYVASYEGDIWSLACILLEVFTRRKIWKGFETDKQLIARLSEEDVVPDLLSDVKDKSIRNILQRCFTKNKEIRPHASELVRTFQEALHRV